MRTDRPSIAALALFFGVVCAALADDRPLDEQPYLGLSVRDSDHGLVVGWIHPGPLGGRSFESGSGIRRGDVIVSIDDETLDRDAFTQRLDAHAPGDEVVLVVRRSPDADPNASVPRGGEGGEKFTVRATLGSRARWTGTIGRGLGDRVLAAAPRGAYERAILDRAAAHGIRDAEGGLGALAAHLGSVQRDALDPNALPWIVHALSRPLSLDAVADRIHAALAPIGRIGPGSEDPVAPLRSAALGVLDLDDSRAAGPIEIDRDAARRLVEAMRNGWTIDPDDARAQIGVINASVDTVAPAILGALEALSSTRGAVLALDGDPSRWSIEPTARGAAQGAILAAITDARGRVLVVGSESDNTYDMSRIDAVVDRGGNDSYLWSDAPGLGSHAAPVRGRVVIDLGGNDRYRAEAPFAGPGVGIFGGSLVDDRAGDDVYESPHAGSVAFALFGVGVIIDHAGDDRYTNTGPGSGWSLGAGFYGFGLVLDRAGDDLYRAEKLAQGVGGPRGFGAIIDHAGRDSYLANGFNFPSAYGTPGVFLGMSQGFGFGVRGYASGGLGMIDDARGNDRYTAGEFSQGGGYSFGLGLLRDRSGNDLYHGNRYGQAFAAHQAAGILIDDAGDDSYHSMTAASQSGAWDESVTMLLDHAGNDAYRCDGLGLGAASMQALSVFIDRAGDDRYSANRGATLGRSGADTYHFATAGVYSFSAFLDLGSGHDAYPFDRARNNAAQRTGAADKEDPARSTLHGLFIDE